MQTLLFQGLCLQLYIPFWLYSNRGKEKGSEPCVGLYIPFWLYSNN